MICFKKTDVYVVGEGLSCDMRTGSLHMYMAMISLANEVGMWALQSRPQYKQRTQCYRAFFAVPCNVAKIIANILEYLVTNSLTTLHIALQESSWRDLIIFNILPHLLMTPL